MCEKPFAEPLKNKLKMIQHNATFVITALQPLFQL